MFGEWEEGETDVIINKSMRDSCDRIVLYLEYGGGNMNLYM